MLDQIEELIGIAAALPGRRSEYPDLSEIDTERYETLWRDLSERFTIINRAGLPIRNPNPHQTLERFRAALRTHRESITSNAIRVRDTYSDAVSQLQQLRETVHFADAPIEVIRDLRESARRLNEVFIVMAFSSELGVFKEIVQNVADELDLVPNFAGRHETGEALSEEILSSIRRSMIVVCDLTFERPNCYYEAGYAKGAFRHVIFTCREDHDPRKYPDAQYKVHFDLDQLKITWWNQIAMDDARHELCDRLLDLTRQIRSLNID